MTVALRPLSFGEILDQAFGLYRRAFIPLVIVSLICSGIPALFTIASQAQGGMLGAPGLALLGLVLALVGSGLGQGAATFVVSEQYLGRVIDANDALRRAWPRFGAILATTMTVGLLTGLAMLLLIIPGIIVAVGFSLAVTVTTLEGLPSDGARARSWELTKGHRWEIFGLVLIYGLIIVVVMGGIGVVTGVLTGIARPKDPAAMIAFQSSAPMVALSALQALLNLLLTPILYCILIVAYYDLRVRKEAFDLDLLATTLEQAGAPRAP